MALGLSQVFHVLNARAVGPLDRKRLLRNGWVWGAITLASGLMLITVTSRTLGGLLGTVALQPRDWAVLPPASMLPVIVGQGWQRLRHRGRGASVSRS